MGAYPAQLQGTTKGGTNLVGPDRVVDWLDMARTGREERYQSGGRRIHTKRHNPDRTSSRHAKVSPYEKREGVRLIRISQHTQCCT